MHTSKKGDVNLKRNPKIKLIPGIIEKLMTENETDYTGIVGMLGVSYTQIYRANNEFCSVGGRFIAKVLSLNPDKRFEDFFFVEK